MRVHVDQAECQGHNRCVVLAPSLFQIDDLGTASPIGDGRVPPELESDALLAVDNCPEYAISTSTD
ncbi:MAG: ferredoxin [Actinomycetota bacterium]